MSDMDVEAAAALLRAAGWTVLPPATDAIPEPKVGQVWTGVETRTVIRSASDFIEAAEGEVFYHIATWRAWAKRTGARPQ